jgi:hypothetical protein
MAVPSYSGDLTGLTEQTLISLINFSNDAGRQMAALRGHVDGAAGAIISAMQSRAGKVLMQRLENWHTDFARVEANFVGPGSLTDRSEKMLIALRAANAQAGADAGAGV